MWPKRGTFCGNTCGSLESYCGAKLLKETNAITAIITSGVTGATSQSGESEKVLLVCTLSGRVDFL